MYVCTYVVVIVLGLVLNVEFQEYAYINSEDVCRYVHTYLGKKLPEELALKMSTLPKSLKGTQ
jgi:hypothetical protein